MSCPDCPICGKLDTFSHCVLTCGGLPNAVTAAHDEAWTSLFHSITSHLTQAWDKWKDKVVHTTGIPCGLSADLKPDGILLHQEDKRIIVLEFKRTSVFWPDSFTKGYLRKWVKYAPLVSSLQDANPGWKVDLAIFVLGDRGLFDEEQWEDSWATLGLPTRHFKPFCVKAVLAAQTAESSILAVYNIALKKLNSSGEATGL